MIVFENEGEIDPRLISLIGVNVKENKSAIGFFGTGLKYAVASLVRWGEEITVQSGENIFVFRVEKITIREQSFDALVMASHLYQLQLGYTTELGKRWEPWMVYRELWCNAHDEPNPRIYEAASAPVPKAGLTRVIVSGAKIEQAHRERADFILTREDEPLHKLPELEIYEGEGTRIFYRGIAVQKLEKPSRYTYNILEHLYLTEDRTAGSWTTDPIIARGLSALEDTKVIDETLTAPTSALESRLDYDYVYRPSDVWRDRAVHYVATRPTDVPATVRKKYAVEESSAEICPVCKRPLED